MRRFKKKSMYLWRSWDQKQYHKNLFQISLAHRCRILQQQLHLRHLRPAASCSPLSCCVYITIPCLFYAFTSDLNSCCHGHVPFHLVVVSVWFLVLKSFMSLVSVLLLSSMDRAFELIKRLYFVRLFRSWVRPAVAVTLSVTQSLAS